MCADSPPPFDDPQVAGPADPEHDPTASYALEPGYVAGLTRRVRSTTGETVTAYSPLAGQPLGPVPQSSDADVARAFATARRAQPAWARTPPAQRAEALLRLHDLVLDRQREIVDLVVWESGKARAHAFDEVMHLALTARYYGRTGPGHLATGRRLGLVPGLTMVEVHQVPKGVVGILSPWNYPFTLALCDGLAALVAGNAVVARPSSRTTLSALLGARLLAEAGVAEELWQVVAGPGDRVGPAVVGRADFVCFTGSTDTGRAVAAGCAARLVGCSLELGGKNPMLVLRDADVDRAAEGAVRGAFSSAGQLCVSVERVYVADQVYDRFVDRLVARTEALALGATVGWGTDMGPLVSREQLDKTLAHIGDAVARGARVLTGGRHRPELAPYFVEPTVLEGVTPAMACFAEETFGPVVALYRFHDEADAVARANLGDHGLNAAVYSRDGRRARAVARRLRCGTVNVNEPFGATFGSIDAPMGGMRASGLGRRQGVEGLLRFTDPQAVATQRLVRLAPSPGRSGETWSRLALGGFRLLGRLGRP